MYVNHRPVFGVGKEHIEQAFATLALMADEGRESQGTLTREQLVYALENLGARVHASARATCASAHNAGTCAHAVRALSFRPARAPYPLQARS